MEQNEEKFRAIAANLSAKQKNVEIGKMFGKLGLKINGNAFVCLFDGDLILKLSGDDHANALKLKGAALWDPSKMNRPMKEWVHIPASHQKEWNDFAAAALKYAMTLPKKK